MKAFFVAFLTPLVSFLAISQGGKVWVTVNDPDFHQKYVQSNGKVVSNDMEFSRIIKVFDVTEIKQALPSSRNKDLLKVFELTCECNDHELLQALTKAELPFSKPVIGPKYESLSTPNDYHTSFNTDYALDLIKAQEAWDITHGNPTIIIAITDLNYYANHEELAGKVNLITPNSSTDYAHGTAVAITAAGSTNNSLGKSSIGYDTHLELRAMDYDEVLDASYSGADIVNLSWASGCDYVEYFQSVINEVHQNGTVIIAAAGNGGTCGAPGNLVYPASFDHVISVTSIGPSDNHERYIGNTSSTHQHNLSVDLSAPGYDVALSPSPGSYCTGNGTSFAAPYVSGTVALMLSVNPCLNPDQVEYILKSTAVNIDALNQSYAGLLGAGRLNAKAAVQMASTFSTFNMSVAKTIDCSTMLQSISLDLSMGGIAPFNIHWSNGATGTSIYNLSPGSYNVIVRDSVGCVASYSTMITNVPPININEQLHDPLCYGESNGQIDLAVTGGQRPYHFLWNNGQTASVIQNLLPGTYFVIVSDSAGCSGAEIYELHQPQELLVNLKKTDVFYSVPGSIDLDVDGGTVPYSYVWSNGASSQDLNNLASGFYEVIVRDAHNCENALNTTIEIANSCNNIDEPAQMFASTEQSGLNSELFDGKDIQLKYDVLSGELTVSITYSGFVHLSLYTISGQLVQEFQNNSEKPFTLSNLAKGEYLILLKNQNNVEIARKVSFY